MTRSSSLRIPSLAQVNLEKLHRLLLTVASALVLTASFLLALYIRLYEVLQWGWYLRAFDPYIRYYLAKFLVDVGLAKGLLWWITGGLASYISPDLLEKYRIVVEHGLTYFTQFWHPWHIDWARVLSPGVSLFAALTYYLVAPLGLTFHEAAVISPALFNALSVFAIAYLAWRITHPEVRLYALMLSAIWASVTPLLTTRGTAGWVDDIAYFQLVAPLGIVFVIESLIRRGVLRAVFLALAALTNGLTVWIWGSFVYLWNIYGLTAALASLYVLLTGRRIDIERLAVTYIVVYLGFVLFILLTPRYSLHLLTSGLSFIPHVGLALTLLTWALMRAPHMVFLKAIRIARLVVISAIVALAGLAILTYTTPLKLEPLEIAGRYLAIVVPIARSPIVQSVAEHAFVSPEALMSHVSISIIPVMVSVALMLASGGPVALLLGAMTVLGVYFTMSMMFLLYLLAVIWIPVAVYALSAAVQIRYRAIAATLMLVVVVCLCVAIVHTCRVGVVSTLAAPEVISQPPYKAFDWIYTAEWLKYKTPQNATILAWWDYGYWIAVLANRTSLADNSTVNATQIALIARLFMTNATDTRTVTELLSKLGKPMFLLAYMPYIAAYYAGYCIGIPEIPPGGDFAKSYWMASIAGYRSDYIYHNFICLGVPTGYTIKPNVVKLEKQELRIAVPCSTTPLLYRAMFSPDVLRASPQCKDTLAVAWVFQRNILVPVFRQGRLELHAGVPFYEGYRTDVLPLPPWLKLEYVPYAPRELLLLGKPVWGWVPVFRIDYTKLTQQS